MTAKKTIESDLAFRDMWPKEARDYLCRNADFLDGLLVLDGKNCCIVGALNIAASQLRYRDEAQEPPCVHPIPFREVAYREAVRYAGVKAGITTSSRIGGAIKRWDSSGARKRLEMVQRICEGSDLS